MKTIEKIKQNTTKILYGTTAVLGAAVLATGTATAQQTQNQNGLGEYPEPYVTDGQPNTAIVVGADADRDAAQTIAESLPINNTTTQQPAPQTPETTGVWAATGGTTLDTRNDRIYFSDTIDEVRDVLTEDDLPQLEETTFTDDAGEETDIRQFLRVGNQNVTFGSPEDNQDPFLYVNNPESVGQNQNLFELEANFGEEINFTSQDVRGEEIQMFGNTYTVSEDTTANELVLLSGREQLDVDSGDSTTFTVDGTETTVETVSVFQGEATVRIDGELDTVQEDDTFNIDGTTLRVQNIIRTGGEGNGIVVFSIDTREITLSGGEVNVDGDDIAGVTYSAGGQSFDNLGSLSFFIGSDDDDQTFVRQAESYSHPLFEDYTFRFGGLSPDAAQNTAENLSVTAPDDETAEVSFEPEDGQETSIEFFRNESNGQFLADADNDMIATYENQSVAEDAYIPTSAGGFSHLWEVGSIDFDDVNVSAGDEASVSLDDQITGRTLDIDLDGSGSIYTGTRVIDGRTYTFFLDPSQETVSASWGPQGTSMYPALDTTTGASLSLTATANPEFESGQNTFVLPSTDSSTDASITTSYNGSWNVASTSTNVDTIVSNGNLVVQVSDGKNYVFEPPSGGTTEIAPFTDGSATDTPSTVYIQPQNSEDQEEAYTVSPTVSDGEVNIEEAAYTGDRQTASLESNDDITTGYDRFGGYTRYDSSNQGSFTLSMPEFQSIAGAAFTTSDGALGTDLSTNQTNSGDGNQTASPNLIFDADSPEIDNLQQDRNLILVGGPAVNSLVEELAQQDLTPTAEEYEQNTALVQSVPSAFENNDALIVAGNEAPDTDQAAEFLSNYEQNQDRLEGRQNITLNTG